MKKSLWIVALAVFMTASCATYGSPPGPGYPPPPRSDIGPQAYGRNGPRL